MGAEIDAVGASSSGAPFGAINSYVSLVPDQRSFAFDAASVWNVSDGFTPNLLEPDWDFVGGVRSDTLR